MHNYSKTIQQLYELQRFSIKMGLGNINHLCNYLNNPHQAYPVIHVAGTNGKGSTSILIQRILAAHGLKVGLYTSPHLVDFRERIRINDDLIEKVFIRLFWKHIKSEVSQISATFFDTTTAMAFSYFQEKKIDIAVIETGLGGRLDSTNILNPIIVVMTPIDIDHMQQLGPELKTIANEKAAIIKKGSILITGRQDDEVEYVLEMFRDKTRKNLKLDESIKIINPILDKTNSIFDLQDKYELITLRNIYLNLAGRFQIDNAGLAYLASRSCLQQFGINFNEQKLRSAYKSVIWPGRLQKVSSKPEIYFDVSHNYSGFRNTIDFIRLKFKKKSTHLLIGLLKDKEYEKIINLIYKYFVDIVITEPDNGRKLPGEIIQNELLKYGINAKIIKEIDKAYDFSLRNIPMGHTLFVMGSHFLIGKLLEIAKKKHLTSS